MSGPGEGPNSEAYAEVTVPASEPHPREYIGEGGEVIALVPSRTHEPTHTHSEPPPWRNYETGRAKTPEREGAKGSSAREHGQQDRELLDNHSKQWTNAPSVGAARAANIQFWANERCFTMARVKQGLKHC